MIIRRQGSAVSEWVIMIAMAIGVVVPSLYMLLSGSGDKLSDVVRSLSTLHFP